MSLYWSPLGEFRYTFMKNKQYSVKRRDRKFSVTRQSEKGSTIISRHAHTHTMVSVDKPETIYTKYIHPYCFCAIASKQTHQSWIGLWLVPLQINAYDTAAMKRRNQNTVEIFNRHSRAVANVVHIQWWGSEYGSVLVKRDHTGCLWLRLGRKNWRQLQNYR